MIILPRIADDYYGPNEALRKHLEQHPRSWETVYREAVGNDLKVKVEGGVVENNFPLIISTDADTVSVDIEGGVGHAPIQFKNLKSARGYTLYQIANGEKIPFDQSTEFGNDFWQTDYDAESNSYKRTYNIPLDGLAESKWQLERSGK